jgi:hypothetical protein
VIALGSTLFAILSPLMERLFEARGGNAGWKP